MLLGGIKKLEYVLKEKDEQLAKNSINNHKNRIQEKEDEYAALASECKEMKFIAKREQQTIAELSQNIEQMKVIEAENIKKKDERFQEQIERIENKLKEVENKYTKPVAKVQEQGEQKQEKKSAKTNNCNCSIM